MTKKITTITTNDLAAQLNLKPHPIRARVNKTGSYYGIIPQKLPNGRLLWPEDSASRLIKSAQSKAA